MHVQISSDQFKQLGLVEYIRVLLLILLIVMHLGYVTFSRPRCLSLISDWISRYEPMLEALSMQQHAMMMILLLIVIVSLFSLVSGLTMMVSHQATIYDVKFTGFIEAINCIINVASGIARVS